MTLAVDAVKLGLTTPTASKSAPGITETLPHIYHKIRTPDLARFILLARVSAIQHANRPTGASPLGSTMPKGTTTLGDDNEKRFRAFGLLPRKRVLTAASKTKEIVFALLAANLASFLVGRQTFEPLFSRERRRVNAIKTVM
jgi:hypothetical protein